MLAVGYDGFAHSNLNRALISLAKGIAPEPKSHPRSRSSAATSKWVGRAYACHSRLASAQRSAVVRRAAAGSRCRSQARRSRSEEHTSELQSRENLVCRLLLEKKNGHAGR